MVAEAAQIATKHTQIVRKMLGQNGLAYKARQNHRGELAFNYGRHIS